MDRVQDSPRPAVSGRLTAGWLEPLAAALALLLLTSAPTIFGFLATPPGKWFSGVVFNVHDTAQYLSWMREFGARLLIENKLTSEPNPAIYFNLHWFIPGRLAAWLGVPVLDAYQIFRVVSIPLAALVGWWFCGLFTPEAGRRRFVFWLATLTSGLGWLWVVYKQITGELPFPHDVYTTPGNTFWLMLASPHLTFALALVLAVLGLAWLSVERGRFSLALAAAGVALCLGLGHIYDLVLVWSVLGAFGGLLTLRDGWRWRVFFHLAVVVVVSAPAALYFAWVSSPANPTWQEALAQYDNLGAFTPAPLNLLIFLGLTFFLAVAGFGAQWRPAAGASGWRGLLRVRSNRDLWLGGWLVVNLIIIYLPLKFAVMLLLAIQFPLAMLAADFVFDRLAPWLARTGRPAVARWAPALLLAAVLPTNLYLLAWRFIDLRRADYPYYLYRSDAAAMECLAAHAAPDDVVLSAFETGHFLPGLTGTRAFLSNAVMTLDFNLRRAQVAEFFAAGTADAARQALLAENGVDYVYVSPLERALGGFDPAQAPYLSRVFDSADTQIYRVAPGSAAWTCATDQP